MKEIKFRAWFHKTNPDSNGDFMMYSSTIQNDVALWDMEPGIRTRVVQSPNYKNPVRSQWTEFWDNVRSFFGKVTIMQYTGLHDKNGKEIYEGDIVACKFFPAFHKRINWSDVDCIGKVIWDYSSFGFEAVNADGDKRYPHFVDLNPEESEVIGNLYENSELLEGLGCKQI